MRVSYTNTFAGTYYALGPISSLGFSPTPSKEECVQTFWSFSYAW